VEKGSIGFSLLKLKADKKMEIVFVGHKPYRSTPKSLIPTKIKKGPWTCDPGAFDPHGVG
jgi:hypothetical protein